MSVRAGYHEQDYATPSKPIRETLTYHPSAALELPEPDQTIRRSELLEQPHWNHSLASIATTHGILKKEVHRKTTGHLWSVDADVYAWVVDTIDPPDLTPCGHQGVRCVEAGETYTCSLPDTECDEQFGREAAEAVIGDD